MKDTQMKSNKTDEIRMLLGLAAIFIYFSVNDILSGEQAAGQRGVASAFLNSVKAHFGPYSVSLIFAGFGILALALAFKIWRK